MVNLALSNLFMSARPFRCIRFHQMQVFRFLCDFYKAHTHANACTRTHRCTKIYFEYLNVCACVSIPLHVFTHWYGILFTTGRTGMDKSLMPTWNSVNLLNWLVYVNIFKGFELCNCYIFIWATNEPFVNILKLDTKTN